MAFTCNFIGLALAEEIFQFQDDRVTRVITAENPTGAKGSGGKRNDGAKGSAMNYLQPGESRVIADIKTAGIIHRLWMTGNFVHSPEDRRNMIIEMYWDGDEKAAVSAPLHDFFALSLPLKQGFESKLFSQPEGRSYNCFVQMPFKKSAKIVIRNLTDKAHMLFYEINYSEVKQLPAGSLYFHAYWHRNIRTELKKDFEILPKVKGKGRFLGCSVGVIGDLIYEPSWFGEGEVKMYLDGDSEYPSICGTGTEDYIGTGWKQFFFANQTQGCPIAVPEKCLYSFYRFHTMDPIFFKKDIRVTIQQMGNAPYEAVRAMVEKGAELEPNSVWANDKLNRIYEGDCVGDIKDPRFLRGGVNFYRRDDLSATAYFYLDRSSTDLPPIQSKEIRNHQLDRLK